MDGKVIDTMENGAASIGLTLVVEQKRQVGDRYPSDVYARPLLLNSKDTARRRIMHAIFARTYPSASIRSSLIRREFD